MKQTNCPVLKRRVNEPCGNYQPKKYFTVLNNGINSATVLNSKGEDVTEYFNISFHNDIVQVDWKKAPSFEEWRKIVGKI
jgi:hypothetical protein